jgi:hypothetical protein
MRHAPLGLGLGAALVLTGCTNWPHVRNPGTAAAPQARVPTETPTAAALVAYLNDNGRRVQALECRELDLDARERLQPISLMGWMVCQKPRNFRLGAKVVGQPAVDMGSNHQEFWFWISKSDPPYLFHCGHADFARGQGRLQLPIQPEWILDALGLGECGPVENYQVAVRPQTLELIEQAVSPQGQPVRKVTVFSRAAAQGYAPQVVERKLIDARGQEICKATISEVQQDRASGAVIPKRVRLVWPAQHIELKMKLDEVTVNPPLDGPRAARLFTRPQLSGVPSYDLARGAVDGAPQSQVRRAGGIFR